MVLKVWSVGVSETFWEILQDQNYFHNSNNNDIIFLLQWVDTKAIMGKTADTLAQIKAVAPNGNGKYAIAANDSCLKKNHFYNWTVNWSSLFKNCDKIPIT